MLERFNKLSRDEKVTLIKAAVLLVVLIACIPLSFQAFVWMRALLIELQSPQEMVAGWLGFVVGISSLAWVISKIRK